VVKEPVLKSLDDVDKLHVPDPNKDGTLPELLKATRIVSQEIGDKAFIIGRADQGPFSLAALLLGMENFLLQLILNEKPDQMRRLFDFSLETVYRYALAQIENGAHMTSVGESLSGPDVCSPQTYKEFEWAYAKRLVEQLQEKDISLAYHICGDATKIVPDMVATGATILELDYKVDLQAVKDATRGKTTVLGPIDPNLVMAHGTPDLVEEKCKEAIEIMAPDGGFILGPGCALPPETPPENIHAMVESAQKYGLY
jgi:MtaA/CmuA family methyltransferase